MLVAVAVAVSVAVARSSGGRDSGGGGCTVSSSPPTPSVCCSHPALLMQHFIMLGHIQAFLTGLKITGLELDVKAVFKHYAIASLGSYLLFSFAYYLFTVSFLFTAWFFVPLAVFEYAGAIATFKVASFVHRRIQALSSSLSNEGDGRCMVEVKSISTGFLSYVQDSKSNTFLKTFFCTFVWRANGSTPGPKPCTDYAGEELLLITLFFSSFTPLSPSLCRTSLPPALWWLEELPSLYLSLKVESEDYDGDGNLMHFVVLLGLSLAGCLWFYPRWAKGRKQGDGGAFLSPLPRVFMRLNDSECIFVGQTYTSNLLTVISQRAHVLTPIRSNVE